MEKIRKTEEFYHKTEKFLKWVGLYNAVKGYPSLLVTIVVSIALMEYLVFSLPMQLSIFSMPMVQVIILAVGTLLAVIGYKAGDFWDRKLFNPRYGLCGRWLKKSPTAFFPDGSDLNHYRNIAIDTLKPLKQIDPKTGERVYSESAKLVKKHPAKWRHVEEPLILSKFARNFIWPFMLGTICCVIAALLCVTASLFTWSLDCGENLAILLIAGFVFACVSALLFIPYFSLRIEHMIRLYDVVHEIQRRVT